MYSSIPDHILMCMGGHNLLPYTLYALWKDGHLLIVQVECLAKFDINYYYKNPRAKEELDKQYFDVLDTVHSVIDTIDFARTNWAYLTKGSRGYRLQQKQRLFAPFTTPLWAPIINENDIKWKKFIMDCEYRVGEWKGQEVDAFSIWDQTSWDRANMMMMNHYILGCFDVTFKVLGHLVQDDGSVVGIVTEPKIGDEVTVADRSLVYDAVAKLQKHGFLIHGILGNMIISEGKFRFVNLGSKTVTYYPPDNRAELDSRAEKEHWQALDRYFSEPSSKFFSNWPAIRKSKPNYKTLPHIPSPERPFQSQLSLAFFFGEFFDQWQYLINRRKPVNSTLKKVTVVSTGLLHASIPDGGSSDNDICNGSGSECTALLPARLGSCARKQRFRPYRHK